ncbi:hypothetical protein JTE90_011449 [Oedothorax gibbosus]|uniref:protein-tyrosine-phosphatase n=1 Tax=Oedothorax gibbosus TaxID=931172 RepID=A0AAV6VB83_9ARAC|nr:hypothetical protein JTE90_011449 [Oedothorax gibbosus]
MTLYLQDACCGSELKFRLPSEAMSGGGGSGSVYRVSYGPSSTHLVPPSNFTVDPSLVDQLITISDVLPGTLYTFRLYFSNESVHDRLVWTSDLPTTPEAPVNLAVTVMGGKNAEASWQPPQHGSYTGFKLSLFALNDASGAPTRNHYINQAAPFLLRDLTPGASYEVRLHTVFNGQDSPVFVASNFTTRPNTPGRFIVWFRNETTLLVLWQPPYPAGVFDRYRVAISPEDARLSELTVEKEREPPGPAQAAFYGLVPGRNYNISVQTASKGQISEPTRAQYRTVPLPPTNVTHGSLTPSSFAVLWQPPTAASEFDRYQVALGIRNTVRYLVHRDEERTVTFDEDLGPGRTYEVVVKTVAGNVASWPVTANITTMPLPVRILSTSSEHVGEISLKWEPAVNSTQDSYRIKYSDMEAFNSGGSLLVVRNTSINLTSLLPGRNYSISVSAVSKKISSEPALVYQPTKPSSPVIEMLQPATGGWNLTWKSDVTSRQDQYSVSYVRNDTRFLQERLTSRSWLLIPDLYPGAGYEVKVYAVSFGLMSESHSYFQTIPPSKPRGVQVVKASSTNMIIVWQSPVGSLYDHFGVRYQPVGSAFWREMGFVNTTSCEIKDLVPGERYSVQVTSVSKKVESLEADQIEQTMYPRPLKRVREVLSSYNVTFEWEVPQGHRDYYIIVYNPVDDPQDQKSLQVAANDTHPMEQMDVIIDELRPGELYSFRFYAVSHNLRSEGISMQTRTKPVIDSVINVVTREHETRTLGIKYTPTPRRSVVFDRYRFQLSDPAVPAQEKLANDTNRLILFDDLVPGRLYNITIWTVSGGVSSEPIHRQTRLYPEPISEIRAPNVTDSSLTLQWDGPMGEWDGFEIEYQDPKGRQLVRNVSRTEENSFSGLRPHHNYTFLVSVLSGYGTATVRRSRPMSRTLQTLESVPGRVELFRAVEVKPNEATLQWSLSSDEQNGVITSYKVTYYVKGSGKRFYAYFEPTETKGVVKGLQPGMNYVFEIQAFTKVGPGSSAVSEKSTPIWPPPPPDPSIVPKVSGRGATKIRVEWGSRFFSSANGRIIGYAIIVAEDVAKDANSLAMPSWSDVQGFDKWPPYQVQEPYFPFNDTFVADFVVGTEDCTNVKGYCNGPLKPATPYRIKIRAFTTPYAFADTVFSFTVQTESDGRALLAGVLVPVCVLLTCLGLALLWRKKRTAAPFAKKAAKNGPAAPDTEQLTSRSVKLRDFPDHYRLMSADSDFRFSEEFDQLKGAGAGGVCGAADLPVNRPKNRFTNILPYDHSRIKLLPTDDEEGTDYINANYIPGHNSPREFIVTQGPLHSTRDDFWRMVWEQNSRAIVMLTRCVEKGREKCDRYWPYDTQPAYYGDTQVTMLNEAQYAHWTISEFKVARNDQSRVVRHFHFTTWPDFGVPEPPQVLVKFVRTFRERMGAPDSKPIVVHCSAGVGRSGTFIALDRVLQDLQKQDFVDIFGIVHDMRRERVWMVQNEQQYICIHQCLMCVLDKKEEVLELGRPESHDNPGYDDDEGIAESGI